MRTWTLLAALGLLACTAAYPQADRHDRIMVVPAAKPVIVDGDLKEWDLSGAVDSALDEKLRPQFSASFALMYDEKALYISAHVVDGTPMVNHGDPAVTAASFGDDCLQIHLCSDPAQPYPLPANLDVLTMCDLCLWYYTDNHQPALFIGQGADNNTQVPKTYTGADSGLVFRPDGDGKGYTVEARIPWSRLNAPRPLRAGDRIACTVQPFWSGKTWFNDIIAHAGLAYADASMWGQAIFLDQGNLPPSAKPKTAAERQLPLTATLKLPDAQATTVSAAVYDRSGVMVRTLLAGAENRTATVPLYGSRIAKTNRGTVDVAWDGCDDQGRPLPVGEYTVKLLTSRGLGQKWVASVHNSGNPPWHTDDGTGGWGGDHSPALGAAADQERVYLLWAMGECSPLLIACRPDGQKLWGTNQIGFSTWGCYAVATDGNFVYVLQDGYLYGESGAPGQVRKLTPEITRFEAATGKPVNFALGKRELKMADWSDSLMLPDFVMKSMVYNTDSQSYALENTGSRFKRTWEKLATHDFGPQELGRSALGLAVGGNTAYVSRYLENRVDAVDLTTGTKLQEWQVERPAGLAVGADGTAYAAAGKGIVRLQADGAIAPVVKNALSAPWGLAVDKDGLLYASDCGDAMQVKVFSPTGGLVRTIGKPGGRPWVGKYDPAGMLEPAGLALDRDGKLWVTEYDSTPIRVSTWRTDGTFVKEYFGPGTYAVPATVDEERPNLVCVHNTLFEVNYATGAVKPVCTLIRETQGPRISPGMRFYYLFRHVQGRTYACSMHAGGATVYLVTQTPQGVPLAEPVAAWGVLDHLQFCNLYSTDIPAAARERYWPTRSKVMYQWHDLNGDRLIQDDEWAFTPADQTAMKSPWREYLGNWVDDDLTFWTMSQDGQALTLKVKEWKNGVPIYEPLAQVHPLFTLPAGYTSTLYYGNYIPDRDAVYLLTSANKDSAVEKRGLNGELVWRYARAFANNPPLPVAGDLISATQFRSLTKTRDGLGLLLANGYYGQYYLLDTDGLYAGALCKDIRTGPKCGPDVVLMENFNGYFFRNKDNGKYYAFGGDTDARIWEVTGIDTLRKGVVPLTIRPEDAKLSQAAAPTGSTAATGPSVVRISKAPAGFQPQQLTAWDLTRAVFWDAGAGRTAKAALAYDESNLYAIYQVTDTSPLANGGTDWATLFKSGDTCEIMLAADPQADPKRERPAAGDLRLLFSAAGGKPVAVLYEAVARPGEEQSPQSFIALGHSEPFQRVVQLPRAVVTVQRSRDGYVLSATVPLKDLGFALAPAMKTRGDLGVLFSNDGGTNTAARTYYFNHNAGILGDLPSESRLQPLDWGTLEAE